MGEPQGQVTGGGEMKESDLGHPPTLGLELEHFLEMPTTTWGTRDRQVSLPESSIDNNDMWLELWAPQLDTLNWWEELTTILNVGDPKKLAQKIHASCKIPGVRYETLSNHKEYTAPPVPKCIKWGMFLPNNLPYQDV